MNMSQMHELSSPFPQGRLVIGLISPGKMGMLCVGTLVKAGHLLGYSFARSPESARRVEQAFPDTVIADYPEIMSLCDLVFIAVPQETIIPVLQQIMADSTACPIIVIVTQLDSELIRWIDNYETEQRIVILHPLFAVQQDYLISLVGKQWIVSGKTSIDRIIGQCLVMELGGNPVAIVPEQMKQLALWRSQLGLQVRQLCENAIEQMQHLVRSFPTDSFLTDVGIVDMSSHTQEEAALSLNAVLPTMLHSVVDEEFEIAHARYNTCDNE